MKRHVLRLSLVAVAAGGLVLSGNARAGNGRIEINQASALAGGITAGDAAGFPVQLSVPGSYVLTGDLSVPLNTAGVSISADRVSLDLNGFSITGGAVCSGTGSGVTCTTSSTGIGINAQNAADTRIGNGRIRGTSYGIFAGDRAWIEAVEVSAGSASGIRCGAACAVVRCKAEGNRGNGISVEQTSRVSDSIARGNLSRGITATDFGAAFFYSVHIRGNVVALNGSNGIETENFALLVDNDVYSNEGTGIVAAFGSALLRNALRSNGGLGLSLGAQAGYRQNVISFNTGGTVAGGLNLGANSCGLAACP